MQYALFKKNIALRHNVDITGWPDDIPFKAPGNLLHAQARTIHQGFATGKITFTGLSAERRAAYEVEVKEADKAALAEKKAEKEAAKAAAKKKSTKRKRGDDGDEGDEEVDELEVQRREAEEDERRREKGRLKKAKWRASLKAKGLSESSKTPRRSTPRRTAPRRSAPRKVKAKSAAFVEDTDDDSQNDATPQQDTDDTDDNDETAGKVQQLPFGPKKALPPALLKVLALGKAKKAKKGSGEALERPKKRSKSEKALEGGGKKRKRSDEDIDPADRARGLEVLQKRRQEKRQKLARQIPPGPRSLSQVDAEDSDEDGDGSAGKSDDAGEGANADGVP